MIDPCPWRIDADQPLVLHSGDSTLSQLTYGQSITDACIDLDTTRELLQELAGAVASAQS